MIANLTEESAAGAVGNKARFLGILKNKGFRVPDGFALDSEAYDATIERNGLRDALAKALAGMDSGNVKQKSGELQQIFEAAVLPEEILQEIGKRCDPAKKYAVRSSGTKEDLDSFSFAGQYDTFLNVAGEQEKIAAAVIGCYKSMFSEVILSYLLNHKIPATDLKMSVLVQEMVDSRVSGIVFTVNPMSGADTEIVAEAAEGLGENIVSGKVVPERYVYDWFAGMYRERPDMISGEEADRRKPEKKGAPLLNDARIQELMDRALEIQELFGYPCDIEFAFDEKNLYILQARAITKIRYTGIRDIWTTADFKDGGVSASVCTPYMWSLYEYIWEYVLRKFLLDSKILKKRDVDKKLGEMFYGRPYWNLSVVKLAMSKVPGYKEREFDSEFGVKIVYDGDGQTTKVTPGSLWGIARIAIQQKKIVSYRKEHAEQFKQELLAIYEDYLKKYREQAKAGNLSADETEKLWYQLTKEDYLRSESTYFWQIFINTIHQSLYKDGLLKYVSEAEYLSLLGGIDQISHLLPFYDMWELTRQMRKNQVTLHFWREHSVEDIAAAMADTDRFGLREVKEFIEKYGYHSNKELDVTYPCYYEDVAAIVGMFKDTLELDDEYSPVNDKNRQKEAYENQLQKIEGKVSKATYRKVHQKIEGMRKMLWWREEFRDVSTRFYYIIRVYTMKLAESYVARGVLENAEDVWYLKVGDLWEFVDQKTDKTHLREIIARNRRYYNCFRNFMSENEIGSIFDEEEKGKTGTKEGMFGIGCNNGRVTATARVVESFDEIDRIQKGDILVTKFTDTGWTCKFAMLAGIVTEYGGILCHAAIVSREYGIPCIVCAHDIMKQIKDGETITIDGTTGEITRG